MANAIKWQLFKVNLHVSLVFEFGFIPNIQQLHGNEIIISTTVAIRDHDTISITLHVVLNCHGGNLSLPLFNRRQLIAEMSNMSNVETITS